MPLTHYGVLLGSKAGYHRDPPDNFGRFYHGHIDVQTPGQLYNTAIDVDSNRPNVSVKGRVLPLRVGEWQSIFSLAHGFHQLASNETSGAVDYIRDVRLKNLLFIPEYVDGPNPWWSAASEIWLAARRGPRAPGLGSQSALANAWSYRGTRCACRGHGRPVSLCVCQVSWNDLPLDIIAPNLAFDAASAAAEAPTQAQLDDPNFASTSHV
jgi:hypothetical protein